MNIAIKKISFLAFSFITISIHATPDEELLRAAQNNDAAAAYCALCNGANPNAQNVWGDTALHHAAHHNNAQMAQLMLYVRANTEMTNYCGMTPLHMAVCHILTSYKTDHVAVQLLAAGAKNSDAFNGITPLQIALTLQNHAIVNFIYQKY